MTFNSEAHNKSVDYFSDDENNEEYQDEEQSEESDDGFDEHTRQIIFQAISSNDQEYNFNNIQSKPTKNKTKKTKGSMSLEQFNKKIEEERIANQPKKFTSKRVEEKKKTSGFVSNDKPKRNFNPRLPPYNFVHKKQETNKSVNISNINDFPSLK